MTTFTLPALVTLIVLTAAIVLFLTNRIRADIVALLVLVSLGVTGVLTTQETFSGFSRSAVITIMAIFVLAQGLTLTGVSKLVGDWLLRMSGKSESRLIILVMACGALLSLVMNNIAAASVLTIGVPRHPSPPYIFEWLSDATAIVPGKAYPSSHIIWCPIPRPAG